MNLSRFEKPSRYINRELNAIHKSAPVRVALAFPDIYDVGMSHLGLRILYSIINDLPFASAERVFSPWLDLEAEMRAKGIPLMSLESKRPARSFDVVGFSLQYELSYPTVLNMLSLSGIPLRAEARDSSFPLIIAGGPCTVNPAPMSAFIDAFLIGDGEDAVQDILATVHSWKSGGDGRKESLLKGLAKIEGVLVPCMHGTMRVTRRYRGSLEDAPYPLAPVVPYTSIVHDRVTIEISRGCTMGCRFCQAGMIYRPLRERSPERILGIAEDSLRNTGYEEISLTSLSAGDYSSLLPLVREMNRRFSQRFVSLSLPSLRVGAVNRDVLREIRTVRKTGFTMAPEAATPRLRAVINKDFGDEDYERALHALFAEGWETIKLYFMVGLPTERDEDIEAIPEMALKAIRTAKKYSRRYVNVNVGISPLVPKPHTPMQWCGQEDMEVIKARMGFLRQRLSKKRMNFKGHNPDMSLLEAVLSRGDASLSGLIEKAWMQGCRLDAWTEAFDFGKWLAAADKEGIDLNSYAGRRFEKDDLLPWDGIDTGVRREFLWKEFRSGMQGEMTPECRTECSGCGLSCETVREGEAITMVREQDAPENAGTPGPMDARPPSRNSIPVRAVRLRLQFSKTGDLRYLSHREIMTVVIRAVRRAGIPVLYSQGFHPSPRLSFGPPLNVGVGGLREYCDMELRPGLSPLKVRDDLNGVLPEGVEIRGAGLISADEPSLQSFISRYEYEIICPDAKVTEGFLSAREVMVRRRAAQEAGSEVNIRDMVEDAVEVDGTKVRIAVLDKGEKKARLGEIIPPLFGLPAEELGITRLALFGWRGKWVAPLTLEEGLEDAEGRAGIPERAVPELLRGRP